MTNFLPAIGFVLFFLFSTYGLGRLIDKIVHNETKIGWAYATTLGIAGWIIYGGGLNYLHMVSPLTLRYSMYCGIMLAVGFFCIDLISWSEGYRIQTDLASTHGSRPPEPQDVGSFFSFLLVFAVLSFTTYYLMPSSSYNLHDDFHSYLHPVIQMLATGGLDFNLLSTLGMNEVGGQLLMRAFPAIYFDIQYANTFDAIICFAIGIGLLIEFGRKIRAGNGIIFIATIIFMFINPQIVNTSSCYSGTLMILGLLYSIVHLNNEMFQSDNKPIVDTIIHTIPVAMFYSSIVSLKATFIVFACVFFVLKFLLELFFQKSRWVVIKKNVTIGTIALILFSPWLLSPSTKYLHTLQAKLSATWMGLNSTATPAIIAQVPSAFSFASLFSTGKLFWGNSYTDYLAIFAALILAAALSFYRLTRSASTLEGEEIILLPVGAFAAIACIFIFSQMIAPHTALRYVIPVLIAIMPFSTLVIGKYFVGSPQTCIKNCGLALVAMHLIIGWMFSGTFIDRVERISQQRTLLSFPITESYKNFMRFIFGGQRQEKIRSVQSHIAAGGHILAWISTPFYLDFARNKITTFEVCNIIGGAYKNEMLEDVDNINSLWNFLRKIGIQYIVWEYEGTAVKNDQWYIANGAPEFFFKKTLPVLANHTKVIYNKDSFAVLDIRELHLDTPNVQIRKQ